MAAVTKKATGGESCAGNCGKVFSADEDMFPLTIASLTRDYCASCGAKLAVAIVEGLSQRNNQPDRRMEQTRG